MFCLKKHDNHKKGCSEGLSGGAFTAGIMLGAAATAAVFLIKKMKEKQCSLGKAISDCCTCFDDGLSTCDSPDNYEQARNNCGCHAEESDVSDLESCGCLMGYPHDDCGGFADSKGDRPNDLSNPEIEDKGSSPSEVKNTEGKSNPQPENKISEVKKKQH